VTLEERMGVYAFADSEDYQIGYRAFLSKRKANLSAVKRDGGFTRRSRFSPKRVDTSVFAT
jgi:hypothetical protein